MVNGYTNLTNSEFPISSLPFRLYIAGLTVGTYVLRTYGLTSLSRISRGNGNFFRILRERGFILDRIIKIMTLLIFLFRKCHVATYLNIAWEICIIAYIWSRSTDLFPLISTNFINPFDIRLGVFSSLFRFR